MTAVGLVRAKTSRIVTTFAGKRLLFRVETETYKDKGKPEGQLDRRRRRPAGTHPQVRGPGQGLGVERQVPWPGSEAHGPAEARGGTQQKAAPAAQSPPPLLWHLLRPRLPKADARRAAPSQPAPTPQLPNPRLPLPHWTAKATGKAPKKTKTPPPPAAVTETRRLACPPRPRRTRRGSISMSRRSNRQQRDPGVVAEALDRCLLRSGRERRRSRRLPAPCGARSADIVLQRPWHQSLIVRSP